MRNFKFRAWDKHSKKMIIPHNGDFIKWHSMSNYKDCLEVNQFSGIKDKKNKEIYEGDIIKVDDNYDVYGMVAGETYQVYFDFGGFRLKPKIHKNAKGYWLEEGDGIEVIGNIYENKELLKDV